MAEQSFPIGQRIGLPGHFAEPVVLESVRPLGEGFECRVRLPDGTPDEAILSRDEAAAIFGQHKEAPTSVELADAENIRLLVESARIRLGLCPRPALCRQPVGHSHVAAPDRGRLPSHAAAAPAAFSASR